MNKKESVRQNEQESKLLDMGFTREEAQALRRISMTLWRWYELECGTGDDRVSRSIERDPETDKPFVRVQFQSGKGWIDKRYPTPDREKGAIRRLEKIIATRNTRVASPLYLSPRPVSYYLQTDPRGAVLYIIRPGDVPEGADVSAHYPRGLCVY